MIFIENLEMISVTENLIVLICIYLIYFGNGLDFDIVPKICIFLLFYTLYKIDKDESQN